VPTGFARRETAPWRKFVPTPTTTLQLDLAVVAGTLSRPPEDRELPSGSVARSFDVTVRDAEVTDSVPVVWFDPPPNSPVLDAKDAVVVVGRVRRRFFQAGGVTQSRTEVVASVVLPAGSRRRVATALRGAVEAIQRLS
jgi:single-strand DNA-binding protein